MTAAAAVITIDGPAAAGKGTIARQVAAALGFHYLDSGVLYRAVALAAFEKKINPDDTDALLGVVKELTACRQAFDTLTHSPLLISPDNGQRASQLAANTRLREALLPLQHAMRQPPGLVADGRDMGTVVFTDAKLRIFLTADLEIRAQRRLVQLKERGICAKIKDVIADLRQRDRQDSTRAVAPLNPAADALVIDATQQSIDDITATILHAYRNAVS